MPKKTHQKLPIQFSMDRYQSLSGLGERGLMTPTYLSTLIMLAELPAKSIVEKKKPLENDQQGICTVQSLLERAKLYLHAIKFGGESDNIDVDEFRKIYNQIANTHKLTSLSVDGLETLEAIQKHISH